MLSNKCMLREPNRTTSTFSMVQTYGEMWLQDLHERFHVHTEASAIGFRENYSYCGEHLNSKKDASKI